MDELQIDSNTVNKALDIASESTKETRKELDKAGAKGVNKLAQLLWASPIGRKADLYIAERPYKMKKALEEMQAKYQKIPEENRVEPSSYIALKGITELTYALDEDYLKEAFENILISDMDDRKQSKVLPAYIELVKQLSQNDAKMLKYFNENNIKNGPIFKIKYLNEDGGFIYPNNNIILINKDNTDVLESIIIDNLSRLKLIEISFSEYIKDSTIYDKAFKEISFFKDINLLPPNIELGYSKGLLKITSFGQNFIDVCLS